MIEGNKVKTIHESLQEVLHDKKHATALLQARLDAKLTRRLRDQLKRDNVKIRDFFEAAAENYLYR
jgi:UTP:GlnB (protein PII) uridylyltransferase